MFQTGLLPAQEPNGGPWATAEPSPAFRGSVHVCQAPAPSPEMGQCNREGRIRPPKVVLFFSALYSVYSEFSQINQSAPVCTGTVRKAFLMWPGLCREHRVTVAGGGLTQGACRDTAPCRARGTGGTSEVSHRPSPAGPRHGLGFISVVPLLLCFTLGSSRAPDGHHL